MLPSVPSGGAPSASGYLVLGIGTESNNSPSSGVVAYGANSAAEFTTAFNGASLEAFVDSGSNGLFFPDSGIQTCDGGWYCPSSTLPLYATTTGASGSPSGQVNFQIADYSTLSASSNNVFSDLGAYQLGMFDWGLPFFLGRNVYIGIDGTSSVLGTGPYWGY
jgi:cell division protein FtsI/penicillin-binding protein 2